MAGLSSITVLERMLGRTFRVIGSDDNECGKPLGRRARITPRGAAFGQALALECERPRGHKGRCDAFARLDDADTSTLTCPCGDEFSWAGGDDGLRPWKAQHRWHLGRGQP